MSLDALRLLRRQASRSTRAIIGALRLAVVVVLVGFVVPGGMAAGDDPLRERLAAASWEHGRGLFRVCAACHVMTKGAAHGIGPNLWGVIGRRVASAEGYGRYTPAMLSFGGVWSPERLDRYLFQPMEEVEGTSMVFQGIPNAGDRADIIAWINQHSPTPVDFGARPSPGRDGTTVVPRRVDPPSLGVFVAEEGATEAHAYCTVCHSGRLVVQQGLTREGWEEVLEYMVEEHGMNPIDGPDHERILGYLSTHYGPDRPNFPLR